MKFLLTLALFLFAPGLSANPWDAEMQGLLDDALQKDTAAKSAAGLNAEPTSASVESEASAANVESAQSEPSEDEAGNGTNYGRYAGDVESCRVETQKVVRDCEFQQANAEASLQNDVTYAQNKINAGGQTGILEGLNLGEAVAGNGKATMASFRAACGVSSSGCSCPDITAPSVVRKPDPVAPGDPGFVDYTYQYRDWVDYKREEAAYNSAKTDMTALSGVCNTKVNLAMAKADSLYNQLQISSNQLYGAKRSLVTEGVILTGLVGAVGGGIAAAVVADKKAKKKEKKKERQALAARGVISIDGQQVECFSSANYQREECRGTLQRLCSGGAKAGTGGCNAFNGFYCNAAAGNESSAYCLYQAASEYCSGANSQLQNSPACQWRSNRPASCKSNPNSLQCLSNLSTTELTTMCANFPNDPLCQQNSNGRVVTQPVGNSQPLTNSGSSTSLSSVVGGGTSNAGSQNLFSDNSQTLQDLYNSGRLVQTNQ